MITFRARTTRLVIVILAAITASAGLFVTASSLDATAAHATTIPAESSSFSGTTAITNCTNWSSFKPDGHNGPFSCWGATDTLVQGGAPVTVDSALADTGNIQENAWFAVFDAHGNPVNPAWWHVDESPAVAAGDGLEYVTGMASTAISGGWTPSCTWKDDPYGYSMWNQNGVAIPGQTWTGYENGQSQATWTAALDSTSINWTGPRSGTYYVMVASDDDSGTPYFCNEVTTPQFWEYAATLNVYAAPTTPTTSLINESGVQTGTATSSVNVTTGTADLAWVASGGFDGLNASVDGYSVTAIPQNDPSVPTLSWFYDGPSTTNVALTETTQDENGNELQYGVKYDFQVAAVDSVGTSSELDLGTFYFQGPPSPVTGLTATSLSATELQVSFVGGNANGATGGVTYDVTSAGLGPCQSVDGQNNSTVNGYTCDVTSGVVPGNTYPITVTATSTNGSASAQTSVFASGPPAVPSTPTVQASSAGSVQLGWAPGSLSYVPDPTTQYTLTLTNTSGGASPAPCVNRQQKSTPPAEFCDFSGIINGDYYSATVTATNAVGTSAPSGSLNYYTAPTVPAAPGSPTVAALPNSVSVTWPLVPAAQDGGSKVIGYTAVATIGGNGGTSNVPQCSQSASQIAATPSDVANNTASCTITGLANGTTYSVYVYAANGVTGTPNQSPTVDATPVAVPAQPANLNAVGWGSGSVTLSWAAPTNTGGFAITSYSVQAYNATTNVPISNGTCSSNGVNPPTTCTVDNLTNGVGYYFTVTASTQQAGEGTPSADSTVQYPVGQPSAPATVSAYPVSPTTMQVSWPAASPSTGGFPIAYYVVNKTNVTSGTTAYDVCTTTPTPAQAYSAINDPTIGCTTPISVPGDVYEFSVQAVNAWPGNPPATAFGWGSNWTTSGTIGVPAAPSTVFASSTNVAGQASVSWNATPDSQNGGASITGYVVEAYHDDNGALSSAGITVLPPATSTQTLISGLAAGQTYEFEVFAQTSIYNSPPSTTNAVTMPSAPGAPTLDGPGAGSFAGPSSDASLGQISAAWTAPTNNGGMPITGYTATAEPGNESCSTNSVTDTSCQVTGLTFAVNYTVTVVATNEVGNGAASNAIQIQPLAMPGAPTNVSAQVGSQVATVSWSAPANAASAQIADYVVTSNPGNFTCSANETTNCIVTGLTNGTSYSFVVQAANAEGFGTTSVPSASLTPQQSLAPQFTNPSSLALTIGAGSASTIDLAVTTSGYPAVTTIVAGGLPPGLTFTDTGGTGTITGSPTVGDAPGIYEVSLVGLTSLGTLIQQTVLLTVVSPGHAPSAPQNPGGTTGDGLINLTWQAPSSDGGSPIIGYGVSFNSGGSGPVNGCQNLSGSTLNCQVTGLTNGTAYSFAITATSANGSSSAVVTQSLTPSTVPGAPTLGMPTPGSGSATLSWTGPANDGGAPVTGYNVTFASGGTVGANVPGCSALNGSALSCTATSLTGGTAYTFAVTASNVNGAGTSSSPSASVTPIAPPSAPATAVAAVVAGSNQASISWTAPTNNGGAAITGYTVTFSDGGAVSGCGGLTGSTLSCTATGLIYGTSYVFDVQASNGSIGPSLATNSVTPNTTPGTPAPTATATGVGALTVSWSAPAPNGSSITGYEVAYASGASGPACIPSPLTATSCVVNGLANGSAYTFNVTATNGDGEGSAGVSASATTWNVPDATAAPTATAGNTQASVSFTAPSSNGSAITGYIVTAIDTTTPANGGQTQSGVASPIVVTGLTNGDGYKFTVTATNAIGTSAASSASASVVPGTVPAIASNPTSLTLSIGSASGLALSATGSPAPTFTYAVGSNGFPSGLTLLPSGAIFGTPGVGTGGVYSFTAIATNAAGSSAPVTFTLTIGNAPAFTTTSLNTVAVNNAVTQTIATTGAPVPLVALSGGALPTGVSLGSTGVLSGTPTIAGAYTFSVTASNGFGSPVSESLTLNVDQSPSLSSLPATEVLPLGASGSFTPVATGYPVPTVSEIGTLPAGLSWDAGAISGTCTSTTAQSIDIKASSAAGTATQALSLSCSSAGMITSPTSYTFTVGTAGSLQVTTANVSSPVFSEHGTLPGGVIMTSGGDIEGTPSANTGGSYPISVEVNGVTQNVTLTVSQAPGFTGSASSTWAVGTAGSPVTISTTGYPTPNCSILSGSLPAGMSITTRCVLSGTPAAGTGGIDAITLVSANGVNPPATETYTITVDEAPAVTSASSVTLAGGSAGSFQMTVRGYPAPKFSLSGAQVPGVSLSTAGLLKTTAVTPVGTYSFTLTASNSVGTNATQTFSLTVT